jgi:tetratricopeptide (TPR) repeat protein
VKWSELNRFSKALLLIMGVLVVVYLVREFMPSAPTERAPRPASHLDLTRPESDPIAPTPSKNEGKLVESLKSPTGSVRDQATTALWKLWQGAAGPDAELRLQAGMDMLAAGHPLAAVDQFSKLVAEYPAFAEAYNKRAIAYFSMADYERSIQDCLKTTELNKNHFGAWSGLGQCYLAIRRYDLALNAFERALELQPFSEENKRAIEFCKDKKRNMLPQDLSNSA